MINSLFLATNTSQCQCAIDYKLLLEYFKVLLSFPTVVLIIAGLFMHYFKKEIKLLFDRIRNFEAGGAKFGFEDVANAVVEKVVEASLQPKQEEIDKLPEGAEKIAKYTELEQEAIAIKNRIRSMLIMGGPVGFLPEIEDIVDDYFRSNHHNTGSLASLPDDYFDKLYEKIIAKEPIIKSWGKARNIQFLSGYWVKYQMLRNLDSQVL